MEENEEHLADTSPKSELAVEKRARARGWPALVLIRPPPFARDGRQPSTPHLANT